MLSSEKLNFVIFSAYQPISENILISSNVMFCVSYCSLQCALTCICTVFCDSVIGIIVLGVHVFYPNFSHF